MKAEPRAFIDIVSTLAKPLWSNVDRIMSIQRQWNNVVSTLKFCWKCKWIEGMFIDVVSTLTKQGWNNIERTASIQHWWPSVVSTLVFGWEWKLSQRIFSALLRRWDYTIQTTLSIISVLIFTLEWLNNKTKISFEIWNIYFLYIKT